MWREFTKETPARPWWALIFSFLALAGTTALAQYMTQSHGRPKRTTFVVHQPGWPISIRLPEGARRVPNQDVLSEPVNSDGTRGELTFRLAGQRPDRADLRLSFQFEGPPMSPEQAFHALTGLPADDAEEMSVGPLSGRWAMGESEDGALVLAAVATSPEGLTLQIEMKTTAAGSRLRKEFEDICSSVEYKAWSVRSPD